MADRVKIPGDDRPPRGEEKSPRAKRTSTSGGAGASARAGETSSPGTAAPTYRGNDRKLHEALTRMYTSVGIGMQGVAMMRGDGGLAIAAVNITSVASDTADAWMELAQQNPRVRATLEGLVQGSAVATLAACHVSMVVPVLASRGVVPGELANMFLTEDAKRYATAMAKQHSGGGGSNGTAPVA
jgi:hypothetical protein